MKINFERTGGFTNMRLAIDIDVDRLPEEDADSLEKLVDEADFFHLDISVPEYGIADGFQYNLSIERGEEHRSLQFDDGSLTENLRPLVNDLSLRARSRRFKK
jgi:hypothetical protein